MAHSLDKLKKLRPIEVPPGTTGVYFALLETGEVKIGCAKDVTERLGRVVRVLGLKKPARLLAVLPGYRQLESDLHAKLVKLRARAVGPLQNEIYWPAPEVLELVEEARGRGFRAEEVELALRPTLSRELGFDDGTRLRLDVTQLHFLETGKIVPRYVLARQCERCGRATDSLAFLNRHSIRVLGERPRAYVVLESTGWCAACEAPPLLPAAVAFADGQTSLRLGELRGRQGEIIEGYDRDAGVWLPLERFGIRRMAKAPRSGHSNDLSTLRLQPYTSRNGRDRGK